MRRGTLSVVLGLIVLVAPAEGAITIRTLSNRADLVSGGDVLVRVSGARPAKLRVAVNGRRVALPRRGRGRQGLVDGLRVGRNTITARAGRRAARLRVVNHAIGGPVFAGPQTQPWFCRNEEYDLGPATDAQCNTDPVVTFEYKDAATGLMVAYDPDSPPPPGAIATATTDAGRKVPWIVRTERGVIARNTYQLKVLEGGWNHKLYWTFGGDCTPRHVMADTGGAAGIGAVTGLHPADEILAAGFISGSSANTDLGSRCDSVVNAETLVMLKEHVWETYGRIGRTISEGGSGGSMQQNWISSDYPGLLDAIQITASYPDVWQTVQQATDCHLLDRVFDADVLRWNIDKQAAVAGYLAISTCRSLWDLSGSLESPFPGFYARNWLDPDNGVGCLGGVLGAAGSDPAVLTTGLLTEQPEWVYDADANPTGARCTLPDYMVSVFGRRPDGKAYRPYDNVGVQYGLVALRAGRITPDDFVTINERVGGLDIDWNLTPQRSVADRPALRIAYRAGLVTQPREQRKIPVFDIRGSSNLEIHTDFNSYVERARMLKANGHHDNAVLWSSPIPLVGDAGANAKILPLLDEWLDGIDADTARGSKAAKVIRNKPAEAVDACWIGGSKITDLDECKRRIPWYADPRITAGGPWTDDVLKCRLRPLDRADYAGTGLTEAQFARLGAAFPDGVCDYTKRAVAERPSVPWLTFARGPGGRPLGGPPRSHPLKRR